MADETSTPPATPAADDGWATPAPDVAPPYPGATFLPDPLPTGPRRSGPGQGYRPSATRARIAQVLIALVMVLDAASVLVTAWVFPLLDQVDAGTVKLADLELHDSLLATAGTAQLAVFVVSAIALLAWLSRAVDNVYWLTWKRTRHSPREAIGWWFVPFANFVVPYQIVNETAEDMEAPSSTKGRIVAWAVLYLGSGLASRALTAAPPTTVDALRTTSAWIAVIFVAHLVAGALLLTVIARIEAGATRLARARSDEAALAGASADVAPVTATSPALVGTPTGGPAAYVETRTLDHLVATADGPAAPPPPPVG